MSMKRFIALAAMAALAGCAGMHKKAAVGVVVATDRYADDLADDWAKKTKENIAKCREELPYTAKPAERFACLEPYTPEKTQALIAAIKTLVAVQLAVKAAAECEQIDTCVEDTDWNELARKTSEAWSGLKPFVLTVNDLEE